jgi:hypothetical protein
MCRARLAGAGADWPQYGGRGPRGATLGGALCLRCDALPALSEAATNYRCGRLLSTLLALTPLAFFLGGSMHHGRSDSSCVGGLLTPLQVLSTLLAWGGPMCSCTS